jgi:hypothetical protein
MAQMGLLLVLGSFGPCYLFPEYREGVSGCMWDILQRLAIVLSRHVRLKSRSIDLNVEYQLPVMASINLFVIFAMSSAATTYRLPTFRERRLVKRQLSLTCIRDVLGSNLGRISALLTENFRSYPQFLQTNTGIVLQLPSKSFAIVLKGETIPVIGRSVP